MEKTGLNTRIARILSPPVFENDEEKSRIAGLVNIVLILIAAGAILVVTTSAISHFGDTVVSHALGNFHRPNVYL